MIPINIVNDDSGDLFVTVTDNNTRPPAAVLSNRRINENDSVPVQVQEDGNDRGNISWTATRADDPDRTRTDSETPPANDSVRVTTFGA